jgi:hypothetical protein
VNPSRFVSWLENTTSGCTLPPHPRVQHAAIKQSDAEGFVVTYIPQSQLLPHRCIVEKDQYLIRAGSDFIPVPHGVLQGMFGRSPTPVLSHAWQNAAEGDSRLSYVEGPVPAVSVSFLIRNDGLCPVEDVYFNVNLILPGPNCNWSVGHPGADWRIHYSVMGYHLITLSGKKLAPAGVLCPTSIEVDLKPPFVCDLSYEITFGCTGSAVRQVAATPSQNEIAAALNRFLAGRDQHPLRSGQELASFVFALDQAGRRTACAGSSAAHWARDGTGGPRTGNTTIASRAESYHCIQRSPPGFPPRRLFSVLVACSGLRETGPLYRRFSSLLAGLRLGGRNWAAVSAYACVYA